MDLYSSTELMGLVDYTEPMPYYMLEMHFAEQRFTKAEEIAMDEIFDDVRIAPFVAPVNEGQTVVHEGYNTTMLKPAYTKLTDPIRIQNITKRMPGQPLNQPVDRLAQLRAARVRRLEQHRRSIRTLEEWMAWQYALNGSYTVSSDKYPTRFIDFQRNAALTVPLSGGDQWTVANTATAGILDDIEEWSGLLLTHAQAPGVKLIVPPERWAAMRENKQFKDAFGLFKQTGGDLPNISPTLAARIQNKGFHGNFEIHVVNTTYTDAAGVKQRYLPANKVLMVASAEVGGVRAYGKIENLKHVEEGDGMIDIYHNEWRTPNGAAINLDSESSPLVFGRKANAFLCATVA
jgi:hypothetical protein